MVKCHGRQITQQLHRHLVHLEVEDRIRDSTSRILAMDLSTPLTAEEFEAYTTMRKVAIRSLSITTTDQSLAMRILKPLLCRARKFQKGSRLATQMEAERVSLGHISITHIDHAKIVRRLTHCRD